MKNFRIFTEGKGDIKFLKDYITEILGIPLDETDFDPLGSWAGYKAGGHIKASIKQNVEDEKTTILILDADKDFTKRKNEVISDFEKYSLPEELFLFPNNSLSGNIENLLAEIAKERKIMNCFLEYENCVSGHRKPLNHSRIYSYLDMLLYPNPYNVDGKDLRLEANRNYRNSDHWNLNHEFLNPLKEFLSKHIV